MKSEKKPKKEYPLFAKWFKDEPWHMAYRSNWKSIQAKIQVTGSNFVHVTILTITTILLLNKYYDYYYYIIVGMIFWYRQLPTSKPKS